MSAEKDIPVGSFLKSLYFVFNDGTIFTDKKLPKDYQFVVNPKYDCQYFISLHEKVKLFNSYNYSGARIPLTLIIMVY